MNALQMSRPYAHSKSAYAKITDADKIYQTSTGPAITALKGISFDLYKGEFVSIVGPSGCGKSTLLKCIAGLTEVTNGTVEIEGRVVREPPLNMGIVFQRDVLLDWLNVIDNVLFSIKFQKTDDTQAYRDRAVSLLETLGLRGYERRYPWELSGGMRQRVSICRALLREPELLLMDEPFGALDALTRDELNLELQRIWLTDNKTVLFITHSIQEAVFLSDRVIVMSRGPGQILATIEIDLPRPRSLSSRETSQFGQYSSQIREIFERTGVYRKPT